MEPMELDPNIKLAQEIQQKFELYLLALTFTLLCLAIQTGKFGRPPLADAAELFGWIALLVSGVVGLWRMEWITVGYNMHGEIEQLEGEVKYCKQLLERGIQNTPVGNAEGLHSVDGIIAVKDAQIMSLKQRAKKLEGGTVIKYKIQKALFLAGLVFLILSRAYIPIHKFIDNFL